MAFFEWLEKEYEEILCYHPLKIQTIITKSCQIKAEIVKEDEKEKGKGHYLILVILLLTLLNILVITMEELFTVRPSQ